MIGIFYIVFLLVIAMFVFTFVKIITEWVSNNNSPRLSVDAKIVDKNTRTHHHHHHTNGHHHHSHSHSYYITFEVESGDRMELRVQRSEFGLLVVGDVGVLSFQGTRFLGFERKIDNSKGGF